MTADELIAARRAALEPAPKAPPVAPPATTDQPLPAGTPGEAYTNYVGGPALDYVRNFLNSALPGHPLNDVVASAAVPETLTGVGATLGAVLAPEATAAQYFGSAARGASKVVPIVERMLAPIAGGAAGGLAEKGSPVDAATGAAIGAVTGVPAEVASGVSRWYAGSKLAQRFYKQDPEALTAVVQKLVPEYGSIGTPEDFGKQVWQGVAQDAASEMYDKRMSNVAERAMGSAPSDQVPIQAYNFLSTAQPVIGPGGKINSPRIAELKADGVISKGMTTVQDLMDDIRDLRLKGRTAGGDPKMTLDGRQARDYASELSTDLYGALADQDPKLANYYKQTDQKYARFAEINRYLKQPGIVDENGKIDMGLLQAQLKEENARGLSHSFTPQQFQDLTDAVFRGAPATVVDDIVKTDPHIRAHVGETGRIGIIGNLMSMFRNNKYAGNYDVDFLKPKPVAIGLQRGFAGLTGGGNMGRPLGDYSKPVSLAAPDNEE